MTARPRLLRAVAATLLVAAVVGCSDDPDGSASDPAPTDQGGVSCSTTPRTPTAEEVPWHPSLLVYDGVEADPPGEGELEHLMRADGAGVVRYDPDLPEQDFDELEAWAQDALAVVVVPGDGSAPVVVDTHEERLSCDGVDPAQLDQFLATRAPAEGHG